MPFPATTESCAPLAARLLARLQQNFQLDAAQMQQIEQYCSFLLAQNKVHNLTGHKELASILSNLVTDSLAASEVVDFRALDSIADVGTGAGFPGLALKIAFPHLKVLLIEVNHKKIKFLEQCITLLGLDGVSIVDLDWRTFNRHHQQDVELFVSKAAFNELEICRMFRMNCHYHERALLYWTTCTWQCDPSVAHYLQQQLDYTRGNKTLKFAFFARSAAQNFPFLKQ